MPKARRRFAILSARFQPVIHVGRLNEKGTDFVDGEEDVTEMTIRAVANYATTHFDGALIAEYSDFDVEIRVTTKDEGSPTTPALRHPRGDN